MAATKDSNPIYRSENIGKTKSQSKLLGFLSVIIPWLERWFLVQTLDEDEDELLQDIREIKNLPSEGEGDNA